MAKNPYKVLSRPNTKKADIIRTVLPGASTVCHVYASCATREQAVNLCRLLNLGLEVDMARELMVTPDNKVLKPKPRNMVAPKKRKARGR